MNNFTIPSVFLLLALSFSCAPKEVNIESPEQEPDNSIPVVEINSNYRLLLYDRPIDEESDSDFIDSEVKLAMKKSRLYRSKNGMATKSDTESPDTLIYSEQIPFCADVSESTLIFPNGDSEYTKTTSLDPEINPLLSFHESELDLSKYISKVEIKDGKAYSYNNSGELLAEEVVEMPDYTQFLEELASYQEESDSDTKSKAIKRDINWLRNTMAAQNQTKGQPNASYSIYEREGLVVLEQYLDETKGADGVTVRTLLSPDISKNYGYEQLEGGVLKARCKNIFTPSGATATRSSNISFDGQLQENPARTVVEEIAFLNDGTPTIRVSDKDFRINSFHYNNNK